MLVTFQPFKSFFKLFSLIQGWGIFTTLIVIVGYFLVGWQGLAAYFAGRLCGLIISFSFESYQRKELHEKSGMVITGAEVSFFRAYMLYAMKLNINPDLDVDSNEVDVERLEEIFYEYCAENPGACTQMEYAQ